jgi:hypothetical protein
VYTVERQDAVRRLEVGATVGALAGDAAAQRPEAVGGGVPAGQDGDDARRVLGGGGVDTRDPGGGMRRAQHVEMGHPRQDQIIGIAAAAA